MMTMISTWSTTDLRDFIASFSSIYSSHIALGRPGEALRMPWEAMGTLWEAVGSPWEAVGTPGAALRGLSGTARTALETLGDVSPSPWQSLGKTLAEPPGETSKNPRAVRGPLGQLSFR